MYQKYLIINAVLIDIDECRAGTNACDQTCYNAPGTYTCECDTGYTLNSNGFTCDGMHPYGGNSSVAKSCCFYCCVVVVVVAVAVVVQI